MPDDAGLAAVALPPMRTPSLPWTRTRTSTRHRVEAALRAARLMDRPDSGPAVLAAAYRLAAELIALGKPAPAEAVQRVTLIDDLVAYTVAAPTALGGDDGPLRVFLTRNEHRAGTAVPTGCALAVCLHDGSRARSDGAAPGRCGHTCPTTRAGGRRRSCPCRSRDCPRWREAGAVRRRGRWARLPPDPRPARQVGGEPAR